jgi:hypothetical protein
MRSHLRSHSRDARRGPAPELSIPRGRRPVPTRTRPRTRRISVAIYVTALLLLPTLMVAGFMSAGLWASAGTSATASTAQGGMPSAESGAGAEAPAVADVKGSMTVQQVVDAFPPITAAQILAKLGAPPGTPPSTQLKTLLEEGNSIDVPTLRTWLQEQLPK